MNKKTLAPRERLSMAMEELGIVLAETLNDITGEETPFVLCVFSDSEVMDAHYIVGTTKKDLIKYALKAIVKQLDEEITNPPPPLHH